MSHLIMDMNRMRALFFSFNGLNDDGFVFDQNNYSNNVSDYNSPPRDVFPLYNYSSENNTMNLHQQFIPVQEEILVDSPKSNRSSSKVSMKKFHSQYSNMKNNEYTTLQSNPVQNQNIYLNHNYPTNLQNQVIYPNWHVPDVENYHSPPTQSNQQIYQNSNFQPIPSNQQIYQNSNIQPLPSNQQIYQNSNFQPIPSNQQIYQNSNIQPLPSNQQICPDYQNYFNPNFEQEKVKNPKGKIKNGNRKKKLFKTSL